MVGFLLDGFLRGLPAGCGGGAFDAKAEELLAISVIATAPEVGVFASDRPE
jgi:hypothetical protein